MNIPRLSIAIILSAAAFAGSYSFRAGSFAKRLPTETRTTAPPEAPDSTQLAALGIQPGRQLIAYAFGGSRCGFCQKPETKASFAELRSGLTGRYVKTGQYVSVSIVGVAVNTDVTEGLKYLQSVGANAFDQISIGSGWQNEHVVRWIRRERVANAALPLVVVVRREMSATLEPLTLKYSSGDSVVAVVQGSSAIATWAKSGMPLTVQATDMRNR